jgi:NitT/TauT family transport system substrate-binding protein
MGATGLAAYVRSATGEPPPETTNLRLFEADGYGTCIVPQYIASEFLKLEGFTEVRYVKNPSDTQLDQHELLLTGQIDISLSFPPHDISAIDAGGPIVILAGSHSGCVEVVGSRRVRSTPDLKGKTVLISAFGSDEHAFISLFAKYVGVSPQDINWVVHPYPDHLRLFKEGKIDAFFATYPWLSELRKKKIGHALVNTASDKPWSQHTCCLIATHKEFVGKHPTATKRALRALLKATDICASEPNRVARFLADKGFASYDSAIEMLRELPYNWRDYGPEDAIRFYALRMRELGMIKSTPQRIIAQGTDWRFLKELRRELKA